MAMKIIEYIFAEAKGANIEVKYVPLKYADCNTVVNLLNRLYVRVNLNATSTVILPPRTLATTVTATATGPITIQPPAPEALSVFFMAIPRQNTVVFAAPYARVDDLMEQIKKLDVPVSEPVRAVPYQLKRAAAVTVAAQIQAFWATRYPGDSNQIRVTSDAPTNTLFVQAAPADMEGIMELVARIDSTVSISINEFRVIPLFNSLSDEVAAIISKAIADGVLLGTGARAHSPRPRRPPCRVWGASRRARPPSRRR